MQRKQPRRLKKKGKNKKNMKSRKSRKIVKGSDYKVSKKRNNKHKRNLKAQ